MRILFISDRFPWPLEDGGNQRTYHVLKHLASKHDVTLLAHARKDASAEPIEQLCRVVLVDRGSRVLNAVKYLMSTRKGVMSLFVAKNWPWRLFAESGRLQRREVFDAVHLNHLDAASLLPQRTWPMAVFDTHNCLCRMAGELALEGGWRGRVMQWEAPQLAKLEGAVCRQAGAVLACSDADSKAFLELAPHANVYVVPNGVDCAALRDVASSAAPRASETPPSLVFIGAMDYEPNGIGAEWFGRHVFPQIREAVPEVRFYAVGRNPAPRVQRLDQHPGVYVTGRVDDVRAYLEQASAVVIPLLHGGGTRLKVLEAMAAARPIVSTRKGAEGIELHDGCDIALADDADQFARCVVRLLQDPEYARKMARRARETAENKYDWSAIGERVLGVYDGLEGQLRSAAR